MALDYQTLSASIRFRTTPQISLGLGTAGVVASPLPGPSGNVEYFLWLNPGGPAPQEIDVERAVQEGPQ
jgi:23S rRNA (cytidine1920-2'-O)/16S rRNA (cytidine1409-2'-O)-methyltransferase